MRFSGSLLALLLPCGSARADLFDDAIEAEMARRHVPGVSVLVLKDGKVVREQAMALQMSSTAFLSDRRPYFSRHRSEKPLPPRW